VPGEDRCEHDRTDRQTRGKTVLGAKLGGQGDAVAEDDVTGPADPGDQGPGDAGGVSREVQAAQQPDTGD
jgi:hypothetical protein